MSMRYEFEKWVKDAAMGGADLDGDTTDQQGRYRSLSTQAYWVVWQAATRLHWPPKPETLPEGYEYDGEEPVDVRMVGMDALWVSVGPFGGTVCRGSAGHELGVPQYRWPVRRKQTEKKKRVPLGPEDIGEWVRYAAGRPAHRVLAVGPVGISLAVFGSLTVNHYLWFTLQADGWQHSTDRKNWKPCWKEVTP